MTVFSRPSLPSRFVYHSWEVMTVAGAKRQQPRQSRGHQARIDQSAQAPDRFDGIVSAANSKATPSSGDRSSSSAPAAAAIPGFRPRDLEKLNEDRERFAAARRAAVIGGTDTLYD